MNSQTVELPLDLDLELLSQTLALRSTIVKTIKLLAESIALDLYFVCGECEEFHPIEDLELYIEE